MCSSPRQVSQALPVLPSSSCNSQDLEPPALAAPVQELGARLLFLGCLYSDPCQWEGFPFLPLVILWKESHYLY